MKPYAHQVKAVTEAVNDLKTYGFHALFMEVGTGKSKVIIDTAEELNVPGMIIAAPKSLIGTWQDQLRQHAASPYTFLVWSSTKSRARKWIDEFKYAVKDSKTFVFFVNTEAFQTKNSLLNELLRQFLENRRAMLVIDESSDIKNPKAQRTINLSKLGQRCDYRIISTGTEITNSVLDLYSQFEFLRPGFWGFKSFFFFKNYYAILQERYLSGGRTFKEIIGFRKLDEIQDRIAPYTSRALKKDCLDLPEKIHADMPVALAGESERLYRELKTKLITTLHNGDILTVANKVALFTKFRQLTGGTLAGIGVIDATNAKLEALFGELSDTNEQAIIWSCFTEEVNLLTSKLGKIFSVTRFYGQTSTLDRQTGIEDFTSGRVRLLVANPMAASQGLNLQNAHIQYWYSLPTSAKTYEQAEGRTHRSGQKEVCLYKKIVATDTVDERVAKILEEKTDIMLSFREGNVADIIDLI